MHRLTSGFYLLASVFFLLFLPGCGYQQEGKYTTEPNSGYKWQSLYRQDVQTVAVPIFQNKSYSRGLEFQLTQAVIQQIESRTPYKVVDRSVADTILEGEITSVRTTPSSYSPQTVTPQEQLMTITVNFTWKEIRTGRILCTRKAFSQSVAYYPLLTENSEVGGSDAVDRLALGIVRELEADW
ncbi:MAG TPA: LptE family protein [Tepidisphaeraceae bacterium]|nr:LptE family protein [Tepidisphaeraceae bacterium]